LKPKTATESPADDLNNVYKKNTSSELSSHFPHLSYFEINTDANDSMDTFIV